jgi:hypothetical protein
VTYIRKSYDELHVDETLRSARCELQTKLHLLTLIHVFSMEAERRWCEEGGSGETENISSGTFMVMYMSPSMRQENSSACDELAASTAEIG